MIVYRFSRPHFDALSGEGARLFGGRWNTKGKSVVYTSLNISLSLLELLIHSVSYEEIKTNNLAVIELPDDIVSEITLAQLKANWQNDEGYSKYIGDEFLSSQSLLLLKVPSVIIPEEKNILINPKHKDFKKIKIRSAKDFKFDVRLFKSAQ
jgi:RES domain-containing protein